MPGNSILQIKKFVSHFTLQSRLDGTSNIVLGNIVCATSRQMQESQVRTVKATILYLPMHKVSTAFLHVANPKSLQSK
jgi:hypothetical protein